MSHYCFHKLSSEAKSSSYAPASTMVEHLLKDVSGRFPTTLGGKKYILIEMG